MRASAFSAEADQLDHLVDRARGVAVVAGVERRAISRTVRYGGRGGSSAARSRSARATRAPATLRVLAEHADLAAAALAVALEDLDRRRLAGPVGAEEGEDLAGIDLEVDAAHRLEVSP